VPHLGPHWLEHVFVAEAGDLPDIMPGIEPLLRQRRLAHDADLYANAEVPVKVRINTVIGHVIKALNSGPQCSRKDVQARLVTAGVIWNNEDLDSAIGRLTDSGPFDVAKAEGHG
jgi:hypothetical protein